MSLRGRVLGAVAGGLGLAAAGTAYGVAHHHRELDRRGDVAAARRTEVEDVPLGSLRSDPITVVADDGVPLHVEVDEPDVAVGGGLTVVFVHGYCLSLDCWHFQRAAYRGRVRTVFYDQRSHGRSGRSSADHATIDQLGRDLASVLDTVAPEGPVVLVGHSMGGMSVIAFLEQHADLLGDRVVGVGLVATTAGGLDPGRVLLPLLPTRLGSGVTGHAVRTLRQGHRAVDGLRRAGRAVALVGTDVFSFGGPVPGSYVRFADSMLSSTPFEVVSDFYPGFRSLDKFHSVGVLGAVPTVVVCGTADRLTSIGHSRKLADRIPGARLTEVEGAGHLVLLERHEVVTAELDRLIGLALDRLSS